MSNAFKTQIKAVKRHYTPKGFDIIKDYTKYTHNQLLKEAKRLYHKCNQFEDSKDVVMKFSQIMRDRHGWLIPSISGLAHMDKLFPTHEIALCAVLSFVELMAFYGLED